MLLVGIAALALRLSRLEQRPMHGDEAVHAVKLDILWQTGTYRYNSREYHGPSLYYLTLPVVWLSGSHDFGDLHEATLRIVPVLAGMGLIVLLPLLADGLGRPATVGAAVLTAVSPAMVFYSRYYIQEMLLVCFSFATLVAAWRYARGGRSGWCLLAGACLGLMHATKETSILAVAAMVAAAVLTVLWARWVDARPIRWRHLIRMPLILRSLALGAAISGVLFSACFSNPRGPLDAVLAYSTYLRRGRGDDAAGSREHIHPADYYLGMLLFSRSGRGPLWNGQLNEASLRRTLTLLSPPFVWSEALIAGLAVGGMVAGLWRQGIAGAARPSLVRLLAFYTLVLGMLYSAIPYKTPWCLLGFLHGMILLAGVGAVAIVRLAPGRALKFVACILLAAATAQLTWQSYAANFRFEADRRNPYVYAHTSPDVLQLAERVEALAALHPDGRRMVIQVIAKDNDYWPLPWYLRRCGRAGYWDNLTDPRLLNSLPAAPVIITSPEFDPALDRVLSRKYAVEYFGLRPTVVLGVHVEPKLWDTLVHRPRGVVARHRAG